MKKIYTLFICFFMFAGITAYAQTSVDYDAMAKRKTMELVGALQLTKDQQFDMFDVIKKYEENKLDYVDATASPYPNSKFSVMREKYAADILPEIKDVLTDEQYDTFMGYVQMQ
ncbi:hypothetical protein [Pustulibacterium marinum]|nr:hypothetical protein [Pustulibacterium marinum]